MTKRELEKRVQELEAELGIKTKPTKMDEIEAMESNTMVKVCDAVRVCEDFTGRKLKDRGYKVSFSKEARESTTKLRCMVEELRDIAMNSGDYDFPNTRTFANWVKGKIMS